MKSICSRCVHGLRRRLLGADGSAGNSSLAAEVNSVYPQVQTLYVDLHEHPELSLHEVNTAAKAGGAAARTRL